MCTAVDDDGPPQHDINNTKYLFKILINKICYFFRIFILKIHIRNTKSISLHIFIYVLYICEIEYMRTCSFIYILFIYLYTLAYVRIAKKDCTTTQTSASTNTSTHTYNVLWAKLNWISRLRYTYLYYIIYRYLYIQIVLYVYNNFCCTNSIYDAVKQPTDSWLKVLIFTFHNLHSKCRQKIAPPHAFNDFYTTYKHIYT